MGEAPGLSIIIIKLIIRRGINKTIRPNKEKIISKHLLKKLYIGFFVM